jgi:nucleoside-diphosphate-sugar epimerase
MKELLEHPRTGGRVFLTGGTGFLGTLLAAKILREDWADFVVIPTRQPTESGLPDALSIEIKDLGADPECFADRLSFVKWDGAEFESAESLASMLAEFRITKIIHSAGCLDYFDSDTLFSVNVNFTEKLVEAARRAGVQYFAFVSTAYSAGFSGSEIPESALSDSYRDPTYYTKSKRLAEGIVESSGIPYLIVRPSIVIGSHQNGRYSGKRYGLYQQWEGIERLLTKNYHPELHTVASSQPLNLIHQDVFQRTVFAALQWVPDNEHINVVVDNDTAPSSKDAWRLICSVTGHKRVFFYDSLSKIDLKAINARQRIFLTFARTNLEISTYRWRFERTWIQHLCKRGLVFENTTMDSIKTCQNRFVCESDAFRSYQEKYAIRISKNIEYRDAS